MLKYSVGNGKRVGVEHIVLWLFGPDCLLLLIVVSTAMVVSFIVLTCRSVCPFFSFVSLSPLILYLSGPRSCAVVLRSRFMHCYAYYFLPRGKTRLHGWIIFLVPLNREPSLLFPK